MLEREDDRGDFISEIAAMLLQLPVWQREESEVHFDTCDQQQQENLGSSIRHCMAEASPADCIQVVGCIQWVPSTLWLSSGG